MMIIASLLSLLGWLYLALFHGRFWQPLLPPLAHAPATWPSVDIIVPARDEAEALPLSLPSLLAQDYPGNWRILLVDDHSTDGTTELARKLAEKAPANRLTVITAPELPQVWSGKISAMQAGVTKSHADYILFTDADIKHSSYNLRALVMRATEEKIDLVSQMVRLHCQTFAEKLLIPAYVFFFALLYPFRRANNRYSKVAAAAGGVMLINRVALDQAGGLEKIRSQLIDDCALARLIKNNGGRIELTLTRETESLRIYHRLGDIAQMISRTAYTQLHHSPLQLAATLLGMTILFLAPALLPLSSHLFAGTIGLIALAAMFLLYLPTILFYDLPWFWAFMLPLSALIYMGATVDSARLYWQGKGGMWKGRTQV